MRLKQLIHSIQSKIYDVVKPFYNLRKLSDYTIFQKNINHSFTRIEYQVIRSD